MAKVKENLKIKYGKGSLDVDAVNEHTDSRKTYIVSGWTVNEFSSGYVEMRRELVVEVDFTAIGSQFRGVMQRADVFPFPMKSGYLPSLTVVEKSDGGEVIWVG